MSDPNPPKKSLGQILYAKKLEQYSISIPRLDMRSATWEELGERGQADEEAQAQSIAAAVREEQDALCRQLYEALKTCTSRKYGFIPKQEFSQVLVDYALTAFEAQMGDGK